jgi:hypothetical protein
MASTSVSGVAFTTTGEKIFSNPRTICRSVHPDDRSSPRLRAVLPPVLNLLFNNIRPLDVLLHFSRKCNYEYGFCFHTEKTSSILPLDEAKRGMKLLKEAGMKKLNFAGGEPFLYPMFMRELLRYRKGELGIESISIVSNGSKITQKFLRENPEETLWTI